MAGGQDQRFTAALRLRKSGDFKRVRATGRKLQAAHFIIYLGDGCLETARLGLTVSRKVGGAIQRNRVKRLLREFFRRYRTELPPCDISIIAKPGAACLDFEQVRAQLLFLMNPAQRRGTCSAGSWSD